MNVSDFIGLIVGFLLTVLVFTYIFGDNPFFRLIMSIFVGVAAGFAIVVTSYNVFWNQIARPLINDPAASSLRILPPLLLGLWLLLKMFPRFSPMANPAMAFFV